MKIVIIGASGFVGSSLVNESLMRGHQVTAISRRINESTMRHQSLSLQPCDIFDGPKLINIIQSHDAVLSAYNPGWKTKHLYDEFMRGSRSIQDAVKQTEVKRFLVVGGAGSLEIKPGVQLVDTPAFPAEWKAGALAARDYLTRLRTEDHLDWTFLSPAIEMNPKTSGVRIGKYRTGLDRPVFDENGVSRISVEDTAVALLDELENGNFIRRRFTIAY